MIAQLYFWHHNKVLHYKPAKPFAGQEQRYIFPTVSVYTFCGETLPSFSLSMLSSRALTPPTHSEEVQVAFPADHVLLLTLNRPRFLNAMTPRMTKDLGNLLDWFEGEPELW